MTIDDDGSLWLSNLGIREWTFLETTKRIVLVFSTLNVLRSLLARF